VQCCSVPLNSDKYHELSSQSFSVRLSFFLINSFYCYPNQKNQIPYFSDSLFCPSKMLPRATATISPSRWYIPFSLLFRWYLSTIIILIFLSHTLFFQRWIQRIVYNSHHNRSMALKVATQSLLFPFSSLFLIIFC